MELRQVEKIYGILKKSRRGENKNMELLLILAAFGGGVFGALIGALPAFIMTGFLVIAGLMVPAGGPDVVGQIAFGAFAGPHIAFAGGVAAAAFAKKINVLKAGEDICTPLNKFNNPYILLVGGLFGIFGYVVNYYYGQFFTPGHDTVALTVFTSGVVVRLVFGTTGIIGRTKDVTRKFLPNPTEALYLVVMGLGLGLLSSYFAIEMGMVVLGFGISAATLLFTQCGFAVPGTHHVTLVGAVAAAATGSIYVGALFAILSALLGDVIGRVFNTEGDSHIDPPAGAIFILTAVVVLFL